MGGIDDRSSVPILQRDEENERPPTGGPEVQSLQISASLFSTPSNTAKLAEFCRVQLADFLLCPVRCCAIGSVPAHTTDVRFIFRVSSGPVFLATFRAQATWLCTKGQLAARLTVNFSAPLAFATSSQAAS